MATDQIRDRGLLQVRKVSPCFPLPVVPFEHYMLADDRPDYPMTPFVRLTFRGTLDPQRFQAALYQALRRHPLLRAHVRGPLEGKTAALTWVDAGKQEPFLHWGTLETPLRFPGERRTDLRSEIGIRFWIREGDNTTQLWIQFHHACCDMLGLTRFLEDLLTGYHGHPKGPQIADNELSLGQMLQGRVRFPQSWGRRLSRVPRDLARLLAFYRHMPVPLATPSSHKGDAEEASLPAFCSHFFSAEDVQRLCAHARTAQATLNDLLLRDLFLALDRWNRQHGSPPGWLRVGMPLSLREAGDGSMPAANKVSMVFLDRRPAQGVDPAALLASIRRETQHIKRWNMGLTLIHLLEMLSRLHGGVARLVRSEQCFTTSLLSNTGIVLAHTPLPRRGPYLLVGDAVLERFEAIPAMRPATSAIFAVTTYAGQMHLGMGYDHRVLTAHAARELFDTVVGQIEQSLRASALDGSFPSAGQRSSPPLPH